MEYLLCMRIREEAKGEAVALFLDELLWPWEWMQIPGQGVCDLIVVRFDSQEDLNVAMGNIVPSAVVSVFGHWRPLPMTNAEGMHRMGR